MSNDYTVSLQTEALTVLHTIKNLTNTFWCLLIKKTSLEWMDSSYDLKKEKEIVSR